MTTSPTRLLAERDCASQQVRIGHGGHDVHPLTAGLDRQAIFADPPVLPRIGIQCLMACVSSSVANLSASSQEGSDVARGRSTLVVILSRLSCLVASHHCFRAPC
jgi:hypothetical protein